MGRRKQSRHRRTVITEGALEGRSVTVLLSHDLDPALVRVQLDSGQVVNVRRAILQKPPKVKRGKPTETETTDTGLRTVSGGLPSLGRSH